jgi:hypothetical protein
MWSSSSSAITSRRRLLSLLAAWPLAVFAGTEAPLAGLKRWGSGSYRWFGLRIYDATLWAGSDPTQPPLALRLTYQRSIRGGDIAEASVDEMRKLGNANKSQLTNWGEKMARLFPDVHPDDYLLGVYRHGGADFYYNDHLIGNIDDEAFAASFFGIWLDTRTSAPALRASLLLRSET